MNYTSFGSVSTWWNMEDLTMSREGTQISTYSSTESSDELDGCVEEDFGSRWSKLLKEPDSQERWRRLHELGTEFVHCSVTYGKVIIEEEKLPLRLKTLKNSFLSKGFAGGDKYIVRGILFKFAKDKELSDGTFMYGGSSADYQLASKAAGQELLCTNYFSVCSDFIFTPLMAIVDYCGFRLTAISLLSISDDTLVYGSSDAGATFHNSDFLINSEMKVIGELLNLQEHAVNSKIRFSVCGDIEIHKNPNDGLYYCIDAARLMPPEVPSNDKPRGIYYSFLRPEFVIKHGNPLSSDAFSGWQYNKKEAEEFNYHVVQATKLLVEKTIPEFVSYINSGSVCEKLISSTSTLHLSNLHGRHLFINDPFVNELHDWGINMRYMGKVYSLLLNESGEHVGSLSKFVLTLMVIRVLKKIINKELFLQRNPVSSIKVIVDYFNCLVTCGYRNQLSLFTKVESGIKDKFGIYAKVSSKEIHNGYVILALCQLLGVTLQINAYNHFLTKYSPSVV
eukprot:TRINITY_DN2825_c0_g3_i3.p1 TRINITY_DN2825_c0_g3~~TRINITY_DN2825_c0_g3_i3.p1  ORF type:complete len:507 (+),score=82.33 TRINITY_DN2825_c0_g3_i3:197-1717(+)